MNNGTTIFFKAYELFEGDSITFTITPDTSKKLRIGPVHYQYYYNPTWTPLHASGDELFSDWICHIRTFYNSDGDRKIQSNNTSLGWQNDQNLVSVPDSTENIVFTLNSDNYLEVTYGGSTNTSTDQLQEPVMLTLHCLENGDIPAVIT